MTNERQGNNENEQETQQTPTKTGGTNMTAFFTFKGWDVRIVNPLLGMDKTDIVLYWKTRDLAVPKKTKTCFAAEAGQCGRCQACFNKWVAFTAAGVECHDIFPVTQFEKHIAKYERVMSDALVRHDFSHYSPARIAHTLQAIEQWTHRERGEENV